MDDRDPDRWPDEPPRSPDERSRKRLNRARSRPLSFVVVAWGIGLALLAAGLYSRFTTLGFTPLLSVMLVGICALIGLIVYAALGRN